MDDQQASTNDDYSSVNDDTVSEQQGVSGLGMPPASDTQNDEDSIEPSTEPDTLDQTTASASSTPTPSSAPDLQDIKQQALSDLSPLLKDLDQAPEEQFKTMMMLIQASDNQDLIKEAYSAASKISDDKARAQALLDIINEINYFTQNAS